MLAFFFFSQVFVSLVINPFTYVTITGHSGSSAGVSVSGGLIGGVVTALVVVIAGFVAIAVVFMRYYVW